MNVEFLLAIFFGLGVGGVFGKTLKPSPKKLASRLIASPVVFQPQTNRDSRRTGLMLRNPFRHRTSSTLDRALFELPEIVDLLVVALKAGEGIFRSFETVTSRSDGVIAKQLAQVQRAVQFGAAFGSEIHEVSRAIPHPQVSEFVNKVSLALERGTPLAQMLSEQGMSVREEIRSKLLQQAGRNETRMLIPLVFLILPITVLFAIYPSLELLNFGFI